MHFIDESYINSILEDEALCDEYLQKDILQKAMEGNGLSIRESASLLNISSYELLEELFLSAKKIKEKIFGKRIVLFAPLYISNACVNNCLYCTFRKDNKDLVRKTLSLDEISEETMYLLEQGHKRITLISAEHPQKSEVGYLGEVLNRIYKMNYNGNAIKKINVNGSPFSFEKFKVLKDYNIGTYQCFQETYHYETYKKMHPDGPKNDYTWRLFTMDRAMQAGITDVGIGSLLGLTHYKFETLALLMHSFDLDSKYGVSPHTISLPRIHAVPNTPVTVNPPFAVDDESYKKLVAVIRLTVPHTGIILSSHEKPELRRELFSLGITQLSAGSRTSPENFVESQKVMTPFQMEQFMQNDHRSLDEVVRDCTTLGFLPSFCTACYEKGDNTFNELVKTGKLSKHCMAYSMDSFKIYLENFAGNKTREAAFKFLSKN